MMGKVTLLKDGRLETNFPREWPARASIFMDDGRHYEKFVRHPKGDPENPLTWDEMAAKFRALAGSVLSAGRCGEILDRVATAQPAELPGLCR